MKWVVAILMNIVASSIALSCGSQELPSSTKQQLESLADATEEATEDDTYLQHIAYLSKHPLNLNTATQEDLEAFYFLSEIQIQHLLRYRNVLGNFLSVYELQSVPSWDLSTISKMLPYIVVALPGKISELFRDRFFSGEHTILLRASRILEQSKGFASNQYQGDRNHYLTRYRYQFKNSLQYGITADKDAGEPFFKNLNSKGFDFYSFHFFAKNMGAVKSLAIGDFAINLGQGLVQWQSLAFKKGAEVLSIKRQGAVLKPYTAAGEFYFNRGAGVTLKKKSLEGTFFGSIKKISANTINDSIGSEMFSSFLPAGLHRTVAEQADKNNIKQTSFGSNIRYQKKRYTVGVNFIQHQFSKEYQKREEPYNRFVWRGNLWNNASADYSFTHKNFHLFGEAAIDKNGNKALVNGTLISLHSKVDLSVLHRSISKRYQAIYGNAFTEAIQPNNETGLYMGMSIRPASTFKIDGYADFYQFPWLRYRVNAPGGGKDYLLQLTYEPNKKLELYSRYRHEDKSINQAMDYSPINYIIEKERQNWRTHLSYVLSKSYTIKARAELVWYDRKGKAPEDGFLFFGEIHYKNDNKLSANMRLQYFATDGYNSRLYVYENDVLFSYSIPAFFNSGWRYYLNLSYDFSKRGSLWLRWGQTIFSEEDKIGSGLDEIQGKQRTEAKVQFFYRL